MTLQERYRHDPDLLEYYKQRLLVPGWAGDLDTVELAYIRSQLMPSPTLKRQWGFRPSARRLSNRRIRAVARYGLSAMRKPLLASPVKA